MNGIRIHVHESKLSARRRDVEWDRKDGGHQAERRQGHAEVLDILLLFAMTAGYRGLKAFSRKIGGPHSAEK